MAGSSAFLWIRDGVLINRMPINACAFAVAYYLNLSEDSRKLVRIDELIDFAFAKSGISCREKIMLFNSEVKGLLEDVDGAERYYDKIAAGAGSRAKYFIGAPELLQELACSGKNFITSAVEQSVLDGWSESEQGKVIAPSLTEILGRRENFVKGRDHFSYIAGQCNKIFYVADAVAEIKAGSEFASEFNITPIGFANVISIENVREALAVVLESVSAECSVDTEPDAAAEFGAAAESSALNPASIRLPDGDQLTASLKAAGAVHVVTGAVQEIFANLSLCLSQAASL